MVLLVSAGFPPALDWAGTFCYFKQDKQALSHFGALSWDKELDLVHVIGHPQLDSIDFFIV